MAGIGTASGFVQAVGSRLCGRKSLKRRRRPRRQGPRFEVLEPRLLLSASATFATSALADYGSKPPALMMPLSAGTQQSSTGASLFVTSQGGVGQYTTSGQPVAASLIPSDFRAIAISGSDLFVTNYDSGTVGEYTTSGATVNATLISGLSSPNGIAISGSNIFVVNDESGTIGEYTTSGATVNATLISGVTYPFGIAISGSDLFVTNDDWGTIGEYTTSGATVNATLVSRLDNPTGIAISGSDLFVTNLDAGTIGEYTTSGATINASLITGLNGPEGIAISGSDLFVTNYNSGTIGEYTTSGTTVNASLITGLYGPDGIAIGGPTAPTITSATATANGPGSGGYSIAIQGGDLGSQSAFNGDNTYLNLVDTTQGFSMGYTGDVVTANVTSWSDSSVTISGLAGAYGSGSYLIKPGDQMSLTVANPETGAVSSQYTFTIPAPAPSTSTPTIGHIAIAPLAGSAGNWTMTISGSNFGTQNPFSTTSPDLLIVDTTNNMPAGGTGDTVTANVTSWTDSQIVIQGFGGQYGQPGLTINSGDKLTVSIGNPQTGANVEAVVTVPQVAPSISSVTFAPLANDNWMTTISGTGFGSQSAFSVPTPFLAIEDTTNSLSAAGEGDVITANVTSWADNKIVISGFAGAYAASPSLVFNPGDSLSFTVTNPQTGGVMQTAYVQAIPAPTQAPAISNATITQSGTAGVFNVTIKGSGFGSMQPFNNGNSAYVSLSDDTTGAEAGPAGSASVSVSSWSNSEVILSFDQPTAGAQFGYGDPVTVTVTNPQNAALGAATSSATMPNASVQTTNNFENLSLVNQSLWGSFSAGTNFSYFLGPQWQGGQQSVSAGPLTATVGYGSGGVGLSLSGQLSTGGANAQYPVDAQLTAPADAASGASVTVQTGFGSQSGTATLQTTAPGFGLQISLDANASFNASFGANLPWPLGSVNIASINPSIDWSYPLLGAGVSGISGSVDLPAGFSIGYDLTSNALPTAQQTTSVSGGLDTLTATGQGGDFVSLSDDLVALAAAVAPPPVDAVLAAINGVNGTFLGQALDYHILQEILTGGVHLTESVNFIPQVQVTLTSNTGQTRTGNLGDSFSFTMPQSGPLKLSESLSLAGSQVSTNWGIGADLTGSVPILRGSATVLGQQINFGPLADFSGTLFNSGTLANIISTGDFTVSSNSSVVPISSVADAITIGGGTSAPGFFPFTSAKASDLAAPTPLISNIFAGSVTPAVSAGSDGGASAPGAVAASGTRQTGNATGSRTGGGSGNASIGNQVAGYVFTTAQSGATLSVAEALPSASVGASTMPGLFGGSLLPNILESPLAVVSFSKA